MSKRKDITSVYNRNPENGAYLIEISLDDYSEIFNGWDASHLKKKDIEPELLEYMEQAAWEIPIKEKVEICFYLPKEINDTEKENISIVGIKNNFKTVLFFIDKLLHKNYRQAATYVSIAVLFLIGAYGLRLVTELNFTFSIVVEGFFIGGWFLMWEAFSTFFFTSHETRRRRKVYQRFQHSEIFFKDNIEYSKAD